jgi:hypothetical protein
MPSIRKAKSSQKKSRKNMRVERRVQNRRMVVNMNQPIKKNPKESLKVVEVGPPRAVMIPNPPGVRVIATDIQKPP